MIDPRFSEEELTARQHPAWQAQRDLQARVIGEILQAMGREVIHLDHWNSEPRVEFTDRYSRATLNCVIYPEAAERVVETLRTAGIESTYRAPNDLIIDMEQPDLPAKLEALQQTYKSTILAWRGTALFDGNFNQSLRSAEARLIRKPDGTLLDPDTAATAIAEKIVILQDMAARLQIAPAIDAQAERIRAFRFEDFIDALKAAGTEVKIEPEDPCITIGGEQAMSLVPVFDRCGIRYMPLNEARLRIYPDMEGNSPAKFAAAAAALQAATPGAELTGALDAQADARTLDGRS